MNGKAEAALKQLSSLSKSLNEASDQLNKQVAEIESALNAYKLGVSAWVELKREQEQTPHGEITHVADLGYEKQDGKWGFLISSYCDIDPEAGETTFLRDASRDIRLAAIDKIPELLSALSREASKVTDEATKKTAMAKEIAAALGKKPR